MEQFNAIHSCKRFIYNKEKMFLCKIAHFTMIILFKIYDPCVTFFLPKYRYFAAFKIIFVLLLPKKTTAVRSSDNITRLTRSSRTFKPYPLSKKSHCPRSHNSVNCCAIWFYLYQLLNQSVKDILKTSPNSSLFWRKSA